MSTLPSAIAEPPYPTTLALRLRMTPRLIHANCIDGAWWPRSTDLVQELPALLSAVAKRIGRIRGVLLNQDEWLPAPVDWTPAGNHRVRIGWYGHQEPHVAVLIGDSAKRVDLLVIPPDCSGTLAMAAMGLATTMGNTQSGSDLLTAAGFVSRPCDDRAPTDSGSANASVG